MLDLEAGVHLEVVETAVLVEELDRAGVDVVAALGDPHGRLAHLGDDVRGDLGGRRLLDQLLVAALRRAVAGAEIHAVAVAVGENLHLDVARPGEVALHVALVATEVGERLALGRFERRSGRVGVFDDLHAPPTTAVRRLDGDRVAVLLAEVDDLLRIGDQLGGAGHAVHLDLLRSEARGDLVAHHIDRGGARPDEGHTHLGDGLGEVAVLREEAVAGVDRLRSGLLDHIEELLGVDIALRCGLSAEGERLVREPNVEGVAVEFGVHGHGGDAHLLACPDDPDGDLTTVCDQDFGKHAISWLNGRRSCHI